MEILIKAAQLILSLSILVLLHEFGHFFFAKLFKTRVDKFYLFFDAGFSLFKFKKGETEYGIGWLPLGGYCKIAGMIDESMDKEQMKSPPKPDEYRAKSTWQRFFIISGGVLMNFLLAIIIYSGVLFTWGEQYLPIENMKNGIMTDSLGERIGLRDGDMIVSVGGKKVEKFRQIVPKIILDEANTLTVARDGDMHTISISDSLISKLIKEPQRRFISPRIPFIVDRFPDSSSAKNAGFQHGDSIVAINGEKAVFYDQVQEKLRQNKNETIQVTFYRDGKKMELPVQISEKGRMGVYLLADMDRFFQLKRVEYGLLESIPAGISKGVNTINSYLQQLKLIFKPETKAYEEVGGFITIGKIFPGVWNWQSFWELTAFLSIILAIMNILPIPALDGGHLMFIIYEMVSGHKPSDKFMEYAQVIGFAIVITLVLYANFNDIIRLFN